MMRPARSPAAIPCHYHTGMIHQKIVPQIVTAPTIALRKNLRIVDNGHHTRITLLLLLRELTFLTFEGNGSNQPNVRMSGSKVQNSLRSRQIKTYGHTTEKYPEAPLIELLQRPEQDRPIPVPIGPVTGKSHTYARIENHGVKIVIWPVLCKNFR